MAKRFTDTDKWRKSFFKSLTSDYKLLWLYITDDCNHAGLWFVDLEVASLRIGADYNYQDCIDNFQDKVVEISNDMWFIPSFLEFQYGSKLSKKNNVYVSIEKVLNKYNLHKYLTIEITEEGETPSALRNRISKKVRESIFLNDNLTCQYCQSKKEVSELAVDHIIPIKGGGDNRDLNLTTACVRCNSHKSDIMPDVFIKRDLEFLNPTNKLKGAIKKLIVAKDKDKDKDTDIDKEKRKEQFESFWNLYDHRKDKQKAKSLWMKLSEEDINLIRKTISRYLAETPDKKFRKHPSTYLNQKTWLDYVRSDGKVDESIPIVEPGWVYVGLSEAYDVIRDQNSVSLSEKEAIGEGDDYVRKMMNINPSYKNVGKGWKYRENR